MGVPGIPSTGVPDRVPHCSSLDPERARERKRARERSFPFFVPWMRKLREVQWVPQSHLTSMGRGGIRTGSSELKGTGGQKGSGFRAPGASMAAWVARALTAILELPGPLLPAVWPWADLSTPQTLICRRTAQGLTAGLSQGLNKTCGKLPGRPENAE